MEEETEGLEELIDQRNQRPGFARMISWEFPSYTPTLPAPSRKKRKSDRKKLRGNSQSNELQEIASDHSDVEEEIDDSQSVFSVQSSEIDIDQSKLSRTSESGSLFDGSDSDSYYISAEEELDSSDSDSDNVSSGCAYLKLKDVDDLNLNNDNNIEKDVVKSQKHHRAPSKKQKRKARQSHRILYGDRFLPFRDIDLSFDVKEIKSDIQNQAFEISKQVPTLVDLCLRASKRINIQNSVPYGIRNILRDSQMDKSMVHYQISWFQGILAQLEPRENFEKKSMFRYFAKVVKPLRNIWSTIYYPKYIDSGQQVPYSGSKAGSYILFTDWLKPDVGALSVWDTLNTYHHLISYCQLGVLASLIDLMMPPVLSPTSLSKKKSESETAQIAHALKTAKIRVKNAIKSRFPTVVEYFFNQVIPYVYWARGNITAAVDCFTELAQNDKRFRHKALYLGEIGRMYAQYGLIENATKSYRLSAEIAMQKKAAFETEINGQMMMLCANVYDQGIMTATKGKQAAGAWKAVVTSPDIRKDGAGSCVGDSLLCYHSACWQEHGNHWLEVARDNLTFLSSFCPELLYHLSMIHALLGHEADAEMSYKQFLRKGLTLSTAAPGEMQMTGTSGARRIRRIKQHPWESLITIVRNQPTPKPLNVIWRVQLQPFKANVEGDICEANMASKELNLRLSSDGYITGDMQTYLPPMRGVYLDPYTGVITHNHNPGKTEPWQSFVSSKQHIWLQKFFLIPTLIQLYSDKDGTTVHLLMPRNNTALQEPAPQPEVTTLYWTGSNGQKAKFSLLTKLKDYFFKKVVAKIESAENKTKKWKKDMKKISQKFYDKSWEIDYYHIECEYRSLEKDRAQLEEENKKTGRSKRKKIEKKRRNEYRRMFTIEFYDVPVCYGKTLFLPLSVCCQTCLVFVDCSTKWSFQHPIIHSDQHFLRSENGLVITKMERIQLLSANAIYIPTGKDSCFAVYDKKGNLIRETTTAEMQTSSIKAHFIIKDQLFYTDENSEMLYCYHDDKVTATDIFGKVKCMTAVHDVVAVMNEDGLIFCNPGRLLPLTVEMTDQSRMNGLLKLSENKQILSRPFVNSDISVLCITETSVNGIGTNKVILAVDTIILHLSIPLDTLPGAKREVTVLNVINLPGKATEASMISNTAGFLVTWTQHLPDSNSYREHLFHFDNHGQLLSVLPFLGKGPRSFFTVYLPGDSNCQKENPDHGKPGWYLYMRDGHEGIIGVFLTP